MTGIVVFLNRGDWRHRVTQGHLAGQNLPSLSSPPTSTCWSLLGSPLLRGPGASKVWASAHETGAGVGDVDLVQGRSTAKYSLGNHWGWRSLWSPCEGEEWWNMGSGTKILFPGAGGLGSYAERLPHTEFQHFKEKWNSWNSFLHAVRMGKRAVKLLAEVKQWKCIYLFFLLTKSSWSKCPDTQTHGWD